MRLLSNLAICLLAAIGTASGQVRLDGLRLGYAVDEAARSIRPVVGIPGSAYLGAPVSLPFAVRSAAMRGTLMVAISDGGDPHAFAVQDLDLGAPRVIDLAPARQAYIDETGNYAILVSRDEIRLVTELAGTPKLSEAILSGTPVSAVTFLQGQPCALLATSAALHKVCADRPSEAVWIRNLDGVTVAAMAHSSEFGLALMDRSQNRILALRSPIESSLLEEAASALDGIDQPVALATANSDILVAAAGSSRILVLLARSRKVAAAIDLPATPDRLEVLAANRIFACTGMLDQPLLVIDLLQDRTPFFIPILRGAP